MSTSIVNKLDTKSELILDLLAELFDNLNHHEGYQSVSTLIFLFFSGVGIFFFSPMYNLK